MTIIKWKKEYYNMAIDNLKKYVSEAYPTVNQLLRNGMDASMYTFDSLFEEGSIPQPLYRLTDNKYIHIKDGIFADKGYLSCTYNFDSVIAHVKGVNIACLQFDMPKRFECINVCVLLPENNNEGEIILPRGLRFKVEKIQEYSTPSEIQEFLDNIGSISSAKEICDFYRIGTIHYYKLQLPKQPCIISALAKPII